MLVIVACGAIGWWRTPVVDRRFIGTWENRRDGEPGVFAVVRLTADGWAEYFPAGERRPVYFRWRSDASKFAYGTAYQGKLNSRARGLWDDVVSLAAGRLTRQESEFQVTEVGPAAFTIQKSPKERAIRFTRPSE